MCTITIRKFVLCLILFVLCITFNAVVHKSVFTISLLRNSTRCCTTQTIDTIDSNVSNPPPVEVSTAYVVKKPRQDTEDGENVLDDNLNDYRLSRISDGDTDFSGKSGPSPSLGPDKKFCENFSDYSALPSNFSTKAPKKPSPIVGNAVWPFSLFGGLGGISDDEGPISMQDLPPVVVGTSAEGQTSMEAEVRVISELEEAGSKAESKAGSESDSVSLVQATEKKDGKSEESAKKGSKKRSVVKAAPKGGVSERIPEGFHFASEAPEPQKEMVAENVPATVLDSQVQPVIYVERKPMIPFPEVLESPTPSAAVGNLAELKASGPSIGENAAIGNSSENGIENSAANGAANGVENNAENSGEKIVQKSETETGNLPLSLDEPLQEAPTVAHFGLRAPVVLPDIPMRNEAGKDEPLVIEEVSDLPEKKELLDFPDVEP